MKGRREGMHDAMTMALPSRLGLSDGGEYAISKVVRNSGRVAYTAHMV